jgi:hypothetical protein
LFVLVAFQSTDQIVHGGSALVEAGEGAALDAVGSMPGVVAVLRNSKLGSGGKLHQDSPRYTEFSDCFARIHVKTYKIKD